MMKSCTKNVTKKSLSTISAKLENLEVVFENIKLQLELERNKLSSYKRGTENL